MSPSQIDYTAEFFRVSFPASFVALVEIDRPEKLNAFKDPMWDNLASTFMKLDTDPDVRAVVFTGRGEKGFTAGLDVTAASTSGPLASSASPSSSPDPTTSTSTSTPSDPARLALNLRRHILHLQSTLTTLATCSKPIICALHGISYGLAIDLATACDVRIAASNARLSVAEASIGLAADVGTLARLPKIGCSMSWVKDVCFTARVFDAAEAERAGFVGPGAVVQGGRKEVVDRAVEWAAKVGEMSPVAVVGTKRVIDFSSEHGVADGNEYVAVWNGGMLQSGDVGRAMLSGLRKKRATFEKL